MVNNSLPSFVYLLRLFFCFQYFSFRHKHSFVSATKINLLIEKSKLYFVDFLSGIRILHSSYTNSRHGLPWRLLLFSRFQLLFCLQHLVGDEELFIIIMSLNFQHIDFHNIIINIIDNSVMCSNMAGPRNTLATY